MSLTNLKGITTGGIYKGDSDDWVSIAAFDCRGCEPIKWHPGSGFEVTSTGGMTFEDCELVDDWCEYDDNNDLSVQIMDLESRIEKA